MEANDEWQLQHRYRQVEAMAKLTAPAADGEPDQILPLGRLTNGHLRPGRINTLLTDATARHRGRRG